MDRQAVGEDLQRRPILAVSGREPVDLAEQKSLRRCQPGWDQCHVIQLAKPARSTAQRSTNNTSDENAASTIALNITALTRLTRAALPAFLSRNAGAIINIASVMALHSLPITSLYSGTKGYVVNFSRGLQEELAGTGVRLQLVLPAATATEFYEFAGMPLSAFDPAVVMTAEVMVDAALAGFDQGEAITLPSVHDRALWETYDAARATLFAATQTGEPAPRYQAA
ncbi:MAG: SDR family NAD(P)-dependent oxidoreductase [Mesorhizobium sp.]|nr:MAG: SDR family NAD(P)-dependent oxidoreductase [Mesorhizobium sp.]